ncbi:MAG: HAMP domain-containing histidine kinase [Candidatus Taylorbacteria bacterium]|nr:HAMP domain-containing histidine kinase [Candidatus Taylorbacteria bacterium]
MNTLETSLKAYRRARQAAGQGVRYIYALCIRPRSSDEDSYRREHIFNVIATTVLGAVILLEASIIYSQIADLDTYGFRPTIFSFFIILFAALLALSRRGHTRLASYLFIGLYFMGTTYGIYAWGIEVPLPLLSYAAIIVMSSILLGTKQSFAITGLIAATLITLGHLQAAGIIQADVSWRSEPMVAKDAIEDSIIFFAIVAVSWLSNKDLERSLRRARESERALKAERDTLEEKVEERTRELKAAQLEKVSQLYRFVEFGKLSSGIFHDLLNPLTTVSLTVEKLSAESGDKGAEYKETLDRAVRASKRIESFVQTVRKQLNSESKVGIFSLENEARDAADLLLHKSRKSGVTVRIDSKEAILVHGSSVRFFQVAVNLISNAIDSYICSPKEGERTVDVSILESADGIRFEVSDKGCGIESEVSCRIFDPFFTTKTEHSGIGLGLSTTKDIVEKDFGGKIEVISAPQEGSRFIVTIPLDKKAADRRRRARPLSVKV